jgi:hypothetical protein
MKLEFQHATGESLHLDVPETATVAKIKSQLAAACKTDASKIVLYLQSYRLHDEWTTPDLAIKPQSCIFIRLLEDDPQPVAPAAEAQLSAMGFSESASRTALHQTNGNLARAVELLTQHNPPSSMDSDLLTSLISAGFPKELAEIALQRANGNGDRAMDLLLSGQVAVPAPAAARSQTGNLVIDLAREFNIDESITRDVLRSAHGSEADARKMLIGMSRA